MGVAENKRSVTLKNVAEMIGIGAIVASLLFLAFEIQQSNRIAIASSEIGIRNGYSEFNRGIYTNPDTARLMSKARRADVVWSDTEELQVLMAVTDIYNVWLSVETACDNELAEATTCGELSDDIRAFVGYFPGVQGALRFNLDSYPSLEDSEVHRTLREALTN